MTRIPEPKHLSVETISRRAFLRDAAATGTALAVPTIVTGPLRGETAPSNRINAAQIGCGNIGSNYHIRILSAMPDVRIVAVADAYKSRRDAAVARLSQQYGDKNVVTAHADFREILARKDIDAVIIGAHDNWHTPMSIASARAGKDVYCQKPLALDYSLTKTLREVIRDQLSVIKVIAAHSASSEQPS